MLESDQSRLALRPTCFSLLSVCERLYDARDATAPRTSKGQQSAWKHWTAWCQHHNTDPWRLERHSTDVDHHRESVLQAGFLQFVHLRQSTNPKNGRKAALPSSAVKTLAHIRKLHKDRDFPMVSSRLVNTETRRLLMRYKSRYGVKDLIPKQKQPFTRAIIQDTILGTPEGYKLGNFTMAWNTRRGRAIKALTLTLASTGFRKAEVCVEKKGTPCSADCASRESLTWWLRGKLYNSGAVPSELLAHPRTGDFAILVPPPSKSDPYDMVWGNKPIWLPFADDAMCAFTALAELERHDSFDGRPQDSALFTDEDGLPFAGYQLDKMLAHMLARHYPAEVAKNYSWHSARIFLATSLLEAKASRAEIQALCRWQTEESLNTYAILGAKHYARLLSGALSVEVDAARANTLAQAVPFIDRTDVERAMAANPILNLDTQDALDLDQAPEPGDDADND